MEGFHEVPLLRDRLYLKEQREIQEEFENRCPTPDGDFAFDDPDRPPWPAHSETSESDPPYTSRVARPVLLFKEDACSTHLIASNPHSTPSTQQLPPRFNSATSAFYSQRPVFKPRQALKRLPASSLSGVPVFDNRALQNLLLDNDFLRTLSASEQEADRLRNSTKPSSLNLDENLSFQPRENLVPGLHPNQAEATLNEDFESFFRYEIVPKINPTLTVEKLRKSPSNNKKRTLLRALRTAAAPLSVTPTRQAAQLVVNRDSKNRRKRGHSLSEDIAAEAQMADSEEDLNESLDNTHLNELGGDDYVYQDDEEDEGIPVIPENQEVVAPLIGASDRVPTPTVVQPTLPVVQPSLDILQLGSVIKQSLSRVNHHKDLVVLDGYDITPRQALDFMNQANQCDESIKLSMVIVPPADVAIKFAFACDPSFNLLPRTQWNDWLNHVTMKQAAEIVIKYFTKKEEGNLTLVENFAQIPIRFNFFNREVERATFTAMKTLTTTFSNTGHISPEMHKDLILTIEKKLQPDSRLKKDYFEAKRIGPIDVSWEDAFTRFTSCIVSVRQRHELIETYGPMYDDIVYTTRNVSSPTPQSPHRLPSAALPPLQHYQHRSVVASVYTKQANDPPGYVKQAGVPNNPYTQHTGAGAALTPNFPPPQQVQSVVATRRVHSTEPIKRAPMAPCRSCGHTNHTVQLCPVLFYSDANNDLHIEWKNSVVGKAWLTAGYAQYDFDISIPGYEERVLNRDQSDYHPSMLNPPRNFNSNNKRAHFDMSGGGQQGFNPYTQHTGAGAAGAPNLQQFNQQAGQFTHQAGHPFAQQAGQAGPSNPFQGMTPGQVNSQYATTRRSKKQGKSLASLLAATISKIDVDTNFLTSWIFINQHGSTSPRGCTHPNIRHSHKVQAEVLLDTGSLPGDFISQNLVHKLRGENSVYKTSSPLTVCSGLDNTCYIKDQVIDIGLTFVTHAHVIKTIYITVRVIPNTIDLILGRKTLKELNFFEMTPYEMGMPNIINSSRRAQMLQSLYSATGIRLLSNSAEGLKLGPQSGKGSLPVCATTSNSVICCSDVECACRSTASGITSMHEDCNYVSNHSGNPCSCTYTLAHISEQPVPTVTVASVETPSNIVLSCDEIDNEKTDTFSPFVSETTHSDNPPLGLEDYLSLITFEGTESQIKDMKRLCRKYADIFSDKLPAKAAKLPPFVINANKRQWYSPRNRTAVRLQTARKEREIKRFIDEMLASGIIEKSDAVYYSHPVIVQKTAELFRFCIDYRLLNKCTEASSFPLPNIRALLERIGHYKPDTFGVMDLTSGYHQAPMDAASKVLTAFICYSGVYQFTRLPFGPRRAPSYFQEMMSTIVLNGLMYTKCEMYLDDCIVFARGHEEFLERLERVFQRFRRFGLFLKAKKCRFGMKQIDYVGRQISNQGISMSKEKIEGVLKFPKPLTIHAMRSFLGLANYFRSFVPFHSDVVKPLQNMIDPKGKKKAVIFWTAEANEAFLQIRHLIARCPLLHFMDEHSPVELYTDASNYGIGGVLFQRVEGKLHPISFVSKSLSTTQTKWSTIQKEAFAIFYCCKQLDSLLRDRKFTIFTDHKNLTFLTSDPSAMVNRWSMALQELDYDVNYISGSKNELADAMSRLCPNLTPIPTENKEMPSSSNEEVVGALHEIIPVSDVQLEKIEMCHNSMVGHGGYQRTILKLINLDEQWLDMEHHIRDFIRECPLCQKMSVIKIPVHVHRYTTSTYRPFDTVNIDYIGPFPDNGYVLVMICSFTRWTELYWCPNATAASACECLLQYFGRFGAPSMIRSDRGPHFMNDLIKEFLIRTNTPHNLTLAYSKQENAIVERVNKEVNRHLRAFTFDSASLESYKLCLPFVQRIINSSVHSSTGASPASLLFGNQLNLDRGILTAFPEPSLVPIPASKIMSDMLLIQQQLNNMAENQLKSNDAIHVEVNIHPETIFEVGSFVLTLNPKGPETRLHCRWLGPFKVVARDKSQYTLLNLITKKTRDVHASQIKTFRFNPSKRNPADIARRDYMEFFIEEIIAHSGNKSRPTQMKFHVKWLNYDVTHNTWEPWSYLRTTDQLIQYLRDNDMSSIIPKQFRDVNNNNAEDP